MAVTGPSNVVNEERAARDPDVAYALVNARWNELIPWYAANGSAPQFPELTPFISSWRDFSKKWEDGKTIAGIHVWQPTDELGAAAHDVAMAESNATRRNYVVPRMFISEDGKVTRDASEAGKASGALSPPASPLGVPAKGPTVTIAAPATPSVETQHPIAATINQHAPNIPGAPKLDADKKPDDGKGLSDGQKVAVGLGVAGGVGALAWLAWTSGWRRR